MYLIKTPALFRHMFPGMLWKVQVTGKVIFLTFDDGPVPEITPWVLEQLAAYDAKATFFSVGDNVRKYPVVHDLVISSGHTVANHTFHHLNGWETSPVDYLRNVEKCRKLVPSSLFRPPYGKMCPAQTQMLLRTGYEIVMWDVLSADFDERLSGRQVLSNVVRHTGPGSVVVFHDSLKAWDRLEYALPRTLEHFASRGYRFAGLDEVSKTRLQKRQPELV